MDALLNGLLNKRRAYQNDDTVDRLSRSYTAGLLAVCALIVSTKQFVGEPIQCWCPAYFTGSHERYANTICWVSSTYYLPFEQRLPDDQAGEDWEGTRTVSYYQWIPLMLLAMLVVAWLPSMLWHFLLHRSGLNVESLIDSAVQCVRASGERATRIKQVACQIDRYLMSERSRGDADKLCTHWLTRAAKHCFLIGGTRQGNYLTLASLVVKLCYFLNALCSVYLLDYFLGMDYHLYGVHVLRKLARGEDWSVSGRFPRVTLCSFVIRHQARLHEYILQCALSVNLFNEKIFVLIWFWYVFVALATLYGVCQCLIRALVWSVYGQYIWSKLRRCTDERTDRPGRGERKEVRCFVQGYLRRDGCFLVQLIANNVGDRVSSEVLSELWNMYTLDRRLQIDAYIKIDSDDNKKHADVI